jgi:hypothetical protein
VPFAGVSSNTTTLVSVLRTSPSRSDGKWEVVEETPSRFAEPTVAQRLSISADFVCR